jgi:ribose transport system substrate-binding protein
MAGYRDGYEENCPLPGRTLVLDDADRLVTAETQVATRLEDLQGKRIIIVGLNEDAILGAMAATSAAKRADEVWYSGQLADPSIRQRIACDDHYIASVAQFPERFGEQLAPLIIGALDGEAVPPLVDATLELVTASNVRELFPDTPACPR